MKRPWFGKRRYGYGWGLPQKWQGWVTLLIWTMLVIASTKMLPKDKTAPLTDALPWFSTLLILIVLLFVVCYKTSGKPEWHWGDSDDDNER